MPLFRSSRGFTLLELLIALVIIGLLVGVVGPNLFKNLGKSEITTARSQIDAISKAVEAYRLDNGHFPRNEQGLAALTQPPSGVSTWRGPYLKKAAPPDPWGNAYQYRIPGSNGREFEVLSLGRDGRPGGAAEDADLSN
ncbi:type II secretion system major pseudopilin GspG [Chitinimonas viridis]|uniref:Type II secretion system core protein G n=2 Tax=Chitinimonas TaxID=240411 RepID=A0ABT8B8K5_9NEIS|nr:MULTISPECIES: type II secretion system major pseudopilin GspG [Chitinimonas]MDN3578374.1 type II secretion system major pseudopilin GspG [Chitinimonas viridis]GLR12251.1 type II secretion system protein GspG [Chitinimonas prasina]